MPVKKVKSKKLKVKTIKAQSSKVAVKKTVILSETKDLKIKSGDSSQARNDNQATKNGKSGRVANLSIPVYSLTGRAAGTLSLPKEIFGVKVNKSLLSQAMRVYMTNKKTLLGFTKTRGEVQGSTAKIYRQKGTGRARHGSVRAPIFIGGGITFGPKPRKVRLDLPKRMKKAALLSALSSKAADKNVIGLSGIEKASGKTKEMVKLMSSVVSRQSSDKKQKQISALILTNGKMDNVVRAVGNIPGVNVLPANLLNAYEVLRHGLLLVTKEAINVILGSTSTSLSVDSATPESGRKDSGRAPLARMTIKKGKSR